MKDTKKSARMYQLERFMLGNPDGCTVHQLVTRLRLHRSTIYRYLDELCDAGVPIMHDEQEDLWWIDRTQYLNNVRLRADESLVLYLAARRLARQTHAAIPTVLNALEKLATALRQPTAQYLVNVTRHMYTQPADQARSHVWEVLTQAWVEQREVRITHRKFRNPISQGYSIHPYVFEPSIWGDGTYVIAYCMERASLRTFKVERIEQAELTGESFDLPDPFDPDLLLRHAWGIWYEPDESPIHVRLRFTENVAQRVMETVWHPSQKVTPLSDGGVYWEVDVSGEMELLSWIRSWGPDVFVVEPLTLRNRVSEDLRQAAAAYE